MIPKVAESGKEATRAVPVRVIVQGTMQLTLAPVPAFFRSSSTTKDLDPDPDPDPDPDANHEMVRAESGANHCLFKIVAISGEDSMAPTKAGLPEL